MMKYLLVTKNKLEGSLEVLDSEYGSNTDIDHGRDWAIGP